MLFENARRRNSRPHGQSPQPLQRRFLKAQPFYVQRSQSERKNIIKVNHIREIYPIEELNTGVMEVFGDIQLSIYFTNANMKYEVNYLKLSIRLHKEKS